MIERKMMTRWMLRTMSARAVSVTCVLWCCGGVVSQCRCVRAQTDRPGGGAGSSRDMRGAAGMVQEWLQCQQQLPPRAVSRPAGEPPIRPIARAR